MIRIELNPGGYISAFAIRSAGSLADLRATLRAREAGTFAQQATPRPGAVMKTHYGPIPSDNDIRTCNRAFVAIVSEFVTLLDWLIAMRSVVGLELMPTTPLASQDEITHYVESVVETRYRAVASDRRLTNPEKLARFTNLSEFSREVGASYFAIRRYVEHRDALPDRDTDLVTRRMALFAGDLEITQLPFQAPENTGISLKALDCRRTLPEGLRLELSEDEVEQALWTLQNIVAQEVLAGFSNSAPWVAR
jgi:hypothetical protein